MAALRGGGAAIALDGRTYAKAVEAFDVTDFANRRIEKGKAAFDVGRVQKRLPKRRGSGEASKVACKVPARDLNAMLFAAFGDIRDEVDAAQFDAFCRCWRNDGLTGESRARLAKYPRVLDGTAANHHAFASCFANGSLGIVGGTYVAIDDDGHRDDSARLLGPAPFGSAAVPLFGGAAVQREGLDSDVLEAARKVHDGHVGLRAEADARFHRDRSSPSDPLHDELGHRHHGFWITKPAGSCATSGDLGNPAAAVHVDERGLRVCCDFSGFREASRVGSINLDCRRRVRRFDTNLALRMAATAKEPFDVHELGDADVGADRA